MRHTTKIQRTTFLLVGHELARVLEAGIGLQTGENLGQLTKVQVTEGEYPAVDVIFEKEVE